MKVLFAVLITLTICLTSTSTFAESSTCIFLKFSNDTRYKNVDSASVLSELVFEKLLATGKVNFKETMPIDKDMELMLYDEKMRDINNLQKSLSSGNFNILFEEENFNSRAIMDHAQSIATAEIGQIVSPKITSTIGKEHGADYLIQGTIINLGQGDDSFGGGRSNGGGYFYMKESSLGVLVALRIIKAETGEVVWAKSVEARKKTSLAQVGMFMIGTAKLSSDMYSKMMDEAAQKIVDSIISDPNAIGLIAK